ncbi:hypothetical protein SCATT_06060 [Streptantibioticus cattleyicolor NRRL 8057 = DSM 46488]|uniref:Uncharacterized protein n=1 Tax=Streptantibioticus cattleyicolor (strain ATCC 35852 / DSM 46488 / JCM 4925 / NBRC 14057 / NRRL 8057) TaxID=1003195 RepID=G8WRG0_STREN|nr:hypothetical protein SCATT_06060 [Streptantibioticus cattleyicolor NRRL 8057 = DSM 46488]
MESGEDFADDLDGAVARIGREGVRHFLRQTKMYGDLDASTVQGEGVDVVSVPLALPERRRLTGVSAPFWVYCEEANGFLIASSDPKKATGEPYRVVGMEVDPEVGRGYRVGRTRDGRSIALGHPGRQFWIALR